MAQVIVIQGLRIAGAVCSTVVVQRAAEREREHSRVLRARSSFSDCCWDTLDVLRALSGCLKQWLLTAETRVVGAIIFIYGIPRYWCQHMLPPKLVQYSHK
jgi:hypothetical protein